MNDESPKSIDLPRAQGRVEMREKPVKSWRPGGVPASELLHLAKRWGPGGIAAALIVIFYVIGGHDGIAKIARATSEMARSTEATDALRAEMQALRADLKIEREERSKVMAKQVVFDKNQSSLCDFVSAMNGGRPNPTWCSADSRSIKIDMKQNPPPMLTTPESWVFYKE
jgi:hypothetical protein